MILLPSHSRAVGDLEAFREALHAPRVDPALIVKGQCDYLTWSSAIDYRDTLRNARMIYLPRAGHRLYAERPEAFVAAVTAFLDGRTLPFPLTTQSRPPEDYRGPTGDAR